MVLYGEVIEVCITLRSVVTAMCGKYLRLPNDMTANFVSDKGKHIVIHIAYVTQTPYNCTNQYHKIGKAFTGCDMKQQTSRIRYHLVLNVYHPWTILRKLWRPRRVRCACVGRVCYVPSRCKVLPDEFMYTVYILIAPSLHPPSPTIPDPSAISSQHDCMDQKHACLCLLLCLQNPR